MRKRHLVVCDGCGCLPCECDRDNPHSPGQKRDHFDNSNYDPWDRSIFGEEPSVELLAMGSAAA